MQKVFLAVVLVVTLVVGTHAATSAQSCSLVNGQWRCTHSNDPNGNSAVAFSGSDGGQVYTGPGMPNSNYNLNFGSFGYPGAGNFFPFGPQFPFFGRRR